MKSPTLLSAMAFLAMATIQNSAAVAQEQQAGTPLRVESVTPAVTQFAPGVKGLIFHDEFDHATPKGGSYYQYTTDNGPFQWQAETGMSGGAMRAQFDKGQVDAGSLKVVFGRSPFRGVIRENETFHEIYWRLYVKHEAGWEGNPAKLARATCLASENWTQGFIAHVWGGKDDCLCIDPATGIRDNVKVSTKYNDFDHLKWLGMKNGKTPIFSTAESGRWVCVESHIKLNTPGKKDGVFELWVDGRLEAAHYDLDWHGTWDEYAINAVFVENYWNSGSVKKQSRWLDNLAISTQPIGPVTAANPVTIHRTRAGEQIPWEAEVAEDAEGKNVVWKSRLIDGSDKSMTVDSAHGDFTGTWGGKPGLAPRVCWVRVRAGGGDWSPWHAPFLFDSGAK